MNSKDMLIRSDGTIEMIGDPPEPIAKLGTVSFERASNILPVHTVKRASFLALRWVFGERGLVAEWTRTWSGPWLVTLLHTGEQVVRTYRWECVRWELEKLREQMES